MPVMTCPTCGATIPIGPLAAKCKVCGFDSSSVLLAGPPKNEVSPPGTMLSYPTVRQLKEFLKLRESGIETVFRARRCDNCGKECPKAYECCSEECYNKLHPKKPES